MVGLTDESSVDAQTVADYLLTSASVYAIVQSYPRIRDLALTLAKRHDISIGKNGPVVNVAPLIHQPEARIQLDSFVVNYGFSSLTDYVQALNATVDAYQFATNPQKPDNGLADSLQGLDFDAGTGSAQQPMMAGSFSAIIGAMAGTRPPQHNIDLVTPQIAALSRAFASR